MNERIKNAMFDELGKILMRIIIVTVSTPFIAYVVGVVFFYVTFSKQQPLPAGILCGSVPALAFLAITGATKLVTGHVIHREWWNGMGSLEKALCLFFIAFVIGMFVFSLIYWMLTR